MSSIREVEVFLPSAASYQSAWLDPVTWIPTMSQIDRSVPCTVLEPGTTIRITPMARQFGGWNEALFHPNLRLPMECSPSAGVVVMLEGLATECIAVGLSPDSEFVLGKTYVVHYGASGNVSTVIRRRLPSGHEAIDKQVASRVCSTEQWVKYWLCLVNGKVYVGIGSIPGERCMGALDDSLYNQLKRPIEAVKYIGLGNSALGKNARPLKVRNVLVTTVPETLKTTLESLEVEDLPMVNIDAELDEETKRMMEAYEKECQKNKARAKKFGVPYKEPTPQAFLTWSKARRLRSNVQKGFATGMDISTPEEMEKQRKRAERFGIPAESNKREREGEPLNQESSAAAVVVEKEPLSVVEAWDNEELVRPHRVDPPKALWSNPPEETVEEDEYAMGETGPIMFVPEKVNISSIDWSAFKQIRTDDIMAYFSGYGPSYIEWLGELSCNVLFEDKFSAARAIQNLAQQVPSPPPEEIVSKYESHPPPDLGRMGWSFCRQPMRKISNDRFGRRGTTARIMMRLAASTDILIQKPTSTPAPPPGFTTKRVLGPGSDFKTEHRRKRRKRDIQNEDREEENTYPDGDHPLMSQGLRSGRDGYSVEELEAERKGNLSAEDSMPTEAAPSEVVEGM